MDNPKQCKANRWRTRVERKVVKKESQVNERCVLGIYDKHDPPGKYNYSLFIDFTHLIFIAQINNFLRETLLRKTLMKEEDHKCGLVVMSKHLTQKHFYKMLNYTFTTRNSIIFGSNVFSTGFRVKFSIKSLVNRIHYFKRVVIQEIAMSSKQFVKILRDGNCLEDLRLEQSYVQGPQLRFKADGVSRLKKINISWYMYEVVQYHVTENPNYFDPVLGNISQCPCINTLERIKIINTRTPEHTTNRLQEKYGGLTILFIDN
ncbi:unnamed protein product [Moneuplotes crassus]|uniref:Uncharacterized protein n=1 Tax=Euplotes crassus TaxID=5936 RepID=A0AAD2D3F0_EUPCR|nr:unnamed protein product [Moneuplotes crassus]